MNKHAVGSNIMSTLTKSFWIAAFLTALMLLAGCGGGSGSSGSGGGGGTPFDKATDAKLTGQIQTKWQSLQGQTLAAQSQAIYTYMQSLPQLSNVNLNSDGSISAIFPDGSFVGVATNDIDLEQASTTPAAKTASVKSAPQVTRASQLEIPGSGKAYVLNALEPNRNFPTSSVVSELTAAGYSVTPSTGKISDWEAVSNAGVLVCAAHGLPVKTQTGTFQFAISSPEIYSPQDTTYDAEERAHQVGFFIVEVLDTSLTRTAKLTAHYETHYAILASLISSPTAFSANSIMLSEACSGASPTGITFANKLEANNGLSVYGGWTEPNYTYDANETTLFFLDRALGLNQFAPVDPSNPPPNSYGAIEDIMQSTTRADAIYRLDASDDKKTNQTANFIFPANTSSLATLIPSASSAVINSTAHTLTINGTFGSSQGTVTSGGQALTVTGWSSNSITCTYPAGTQGLVRAISTQGLKGNAIKPLPTLTVTPLTTTINPSATVSYTVTPISGVTDPVVYVWTQTSTTASFSNVADGTHGSTLTTSNKFMNLVTTVNDLDPITVTVTAYDTAGGGKVAIGAAQLSVNFLLTATLTPSNPLLGIGTQQVFTVGVGSTLPAGVKYVWTLTGTAGSIGTNPQTTTTPTITYTAGSTAGIDTLSVKVEDAKGNVLAQRGTQIKVGTTTITYTFGGDWGVNVQSTDGTYAFAGDLGVREQLDDYNNNPIDRIYIPYDLTQDATDPTSQDVNAELLLWIPVGQALTKGETFSFANLKHLVGTFAVGIPGTTPGSPIDAGYLYGATSGHVPTGTLTLTSVGVQTDGTNVFTYSFSYTSSSGGAFSGSGRGTWKHL